MKKTEPPPPPTKVDIAIADLKQVAHQAYVDIANTYQAVLMQDSGWTRQGILPDLTQDTAERTAAAEAEKANEPERDQGKDDPVIE